MEPGTPTWHVMCGTVSVVCLHLYKHAFPCVVCERSKERVAPVVPCMHEGTLLRMVPCPTKKDKATQISMKEEGPF